MVIYSGKDPLHEYADEGKRVVKSFQRDLRNTIASSVHYVLPHFLRPAKSTNEYVLMIFALAPRYRNKWNTISASKIPHY